MVAVIGTNWRLAPCLVRLIEEADERKPNRSHASDGSIGDTAHAARASDHNPDGGFVCAVDLDDDHDSDELGARYLRAHLVASKDPRIKYLIHEGRIWKSYASRGYPAWTSQPYTGMNAHAKHLHVSVHNTAEARNSRLPWWPTTNEEEDDMPLNDADKAWIKAQFDAQNTWTRAEIAKAVKSIKTHATTIRDGLAKLIRG